MVRLLLLYGDEEINCEDVFVERPVVVVAVAVAVAEEISTGFLERFLPLCMCLSQYFESG